MSGIDDPNQLYSAIQTARNIAKQWRNSFVIYRTEYRKSELENNLDALSSISRIASYCTRLIGTIEQKFQRGATKRMSIMENPIDKSIVFNIISRVVVHVEIILMTVRYMKPYHHPMIPYHRPMIP